MKKIKQNLVNFGRNAKALAIGGQSLAENASLIVVSGFTTWGAFNLPMNIWGQRGLLAAAAVIVIRGVIEVSKDLIGIAQVRSNSATPPSAKVYVNRPR